MPTPTDNHGIDDYDPSEGNWDHSDLVTKAEERLVVRDTKANLDTYTPHDGALYITTDQTVPEFYEGDGTDWNLLGYLNQQREFVNATEPSDWEDGDIWVQPP